MTAFTVREQDQLTDSRVKQEILAECDYGRLNQDWNPLLRRLSLALRDQELQGPFLFHAKMVIDGRAAYNWCIIEIDTESVEWLDRYLAHLGGFEVIQARYKDYFGRTPPRPNHVPARILAANQDGNGGQPTLVGWFLQDFLPGIDKASLPFLCGIELISSWESRYTRVYWPAAERVLDRESNKLLADLVGDMSFSTYVTIYAMMHDTGHWSGTLACLPQFPAHVSPLPTQWYGALAELATDMAAIALVSDLTPSVPVFILLSRLFDYMHSGIGHDPLHSALNSHQDTLANTILFERLRKMNGLIPVGTQWHLDMAAVQAAARKLSQDLEQLGAEWQSDFDQGHTDEIKAKATAFIEQDVPREDGLWQFPTAVRTMLDQITDLPLKLSWDTIKAGYRLQSLLNPTL